MRKKIRNKTLEELQNKLKELEKSHSDSNLPVCWRNCGKQNANHYHIFGTALLSKTTGGGYTFFKCEIPLESKTIYFGYIPQKWLQRDKYLLIILLVAGKKTLTRKWLSQESPTLNAWMEITMNIYKVEKILYFYFTLLSPNN